MDMFFEKETRPGAPLCSNSAQVRVCHMIFGNEFNTKVDLEMRCCWPITKRSPLRNGCLNLLNQIADEKANKFQIY